jgi:hypothetical protein
MNPRSPTLRLPHLLRPEPDQVEQSDDVAKDKIRPCHRLAQRNAPAIDPGDRQAKRLAPDQVGELRLPGMNLAKRDNEMNSMNCLGKIPSLVAGRCDDLV